METRQVTSRHNKAVMKRAQLSADRSHFLAKFPVEQKELCLNRRATAVIGGGSGHEAATKAPGENVRAAPAHHPRSMLARLCMT